MKMKEEKAIAETCVDDGRSKAAVYGFLRRRARAISTTLASGSAKVFMARLGMVANENE